MPQFCGIFAIFIMLYEIKNDVFDISNRIKQIDDNYFVVLNTQRKKYEIHYKRCKNTYELTIPFDELDARTVEFVRKTRMANKAKILEEIEKNNALLEIEKQRQIKEDIRRIYES